MWMAINVFLTGNKLNCIDVTSISKQVISILNSVYASCLVIYRTITYKHLRSCLSLILRIISWNFYWHWRMGSYCEIKQFLSLPCSALCCCPSIIIDPFFGKPAFSVKGNFNQISHRQNKASHRNEETGQNRELCLKYSCLELSLLAIFPPCDNNFDVYYEIPKNTTLCDYIIGICEEMSCL